MPMKDAPHLRLRIDPQLLARIERAREKSGRTLTGEIAHRLEQSFERQAQEDLIKEAAAVASVEAINTVFSVVDQKAIIELAKKTRKGSKP